MKNRYLRLGLFSNTFINKYYILTLAIIIIFSSSLLAGTGLNQKVLFSKFQKAVPIFKNLKFIETLDKSERSIKFRRIRTNEYCRRFFTTKIGGQSFNTTIYMGFLGGSRVVIASIGNVKMSKLTKWIKLPLLKDFSLNNTVIIWCKNHMPSKSFRVSTTNKYIKKMFAHSSIKEVFLKKGVNIVGDIKVEGKSNEILDSLNKLGLSADKLDLQCNLRYNQLLIMRKGIWKKPLGIELPITDPTILISKTGVLSRSVWGKVNLDKKDYFLFASDTVSKKNKGLAVALNGETISLTIIDRLLKALPTGPLKVWGLDKLPLDFISIENSDWRGIPKNSFFPPIDNFLLSLSTDKNTRIPNHPGMGPLLIVNGIGKFGDIKLMNLKLNINKKNLKLKANLKMPNIGPIPAVEMTLLADASKNNSSMTLKGTTSLSINKFNIAKQDLTLDFHKKSINFEVNAKLLNVGFGKLKCSIDDLKFSPSSKFKYEFIPGNEALAKILDSPKKTYDEANNILLKAGIDIKPPINIEQAFKYKKMMNKETFNEVDKKVSGLCKNPKGTVVSAAAGSVKAIKKLGSVSNSLGRAILDPARKIGIALEKVVDKVNPFKKKKKKKKKKVYKPYDYEVTYNKHWVRDYARFCSARCSSGTLRDGPVICGLPKEAIRITKSNKFPTKELFVSKLEEMPYWEVDLGCEVSIGAIVLEAGSDKIFNEKLAFWGNYHKYLKECDEDMKNNGISSSIIAISKNIKGSQLMDMTNKDVEFFVIPYGSKIAIIKPMANSQAYKDAEEIANEILKKENSIPHKVEPFSKNRQRLWRANEKLASESNKYRYIRIFKPGLGQLKIKNISVLSSKDADVSVHGR